MPSRSATLSNVNEAEHDSVPAIVSLNRALTIGRAAECDLCLPDPAVSRRHAVIEWKDGIGYVLHDSDSRGGTIVNARTRNTHVLIFGDRIQIGPYFYRFA